MGILLGVLLGSVVIIDYDLASLMRHLVVIVSKVLLLDLVLLVEVVLLLLR